MLYICPTPIGNLGDVTFRVIEVLKRVDFIAAEDTRRTVRLLDRYGIRADLLSFHDFNETQRVEELVASLRGGKDVAVVSDAGMPGLSDPGFPLLRRCAEEDIPVTVLPGPSSISTALVASGLSTDRFTFLGFLPKGKEKVISALAGADRAGGSLVVFESPHRIFKTLLAIGEVWPERQVVVCRELTKVHEEVVRGRAGEVAEILGSEVKGEVVLVMEAAERGPQGGGRALDAAARRVLERLLASGMGTKEAAGLVAELTGESRREVYSLALAVKRNLLE